MLNQVVNDDCLNWFKTIESGTVDCIVTDPPYKIKAGGVTIKHDVVKVNHPTAKDDWASRFTAPAIASNSTSSFPSS